jgi:hypothetical protein
MTALPMAVEVAGVARHRPGHQRHSGGQEARRQPAASLDDPAVARRAPRLGQVEQGERRVFECGGARLGLKYFFN